MPRLWFLILALAVFLRVAEYSRNRSLWHDEARFAVHVLQTPFSQVFEKEYARPPGYVALVKLSTILLGGSEYALRLVPFLFSLLGLGLFALLLKHWLPGLAGSFALSLFAFSGPLIYFSAEAKPYALDVAWGLLFYWLYARGESMRSRTLWVVLVGGLGAAAPWFSYASPFFLCSLGGLLVWRAFHKRFSFEALFFVFSLWLFSFGVLYEYFLSGKSTHAFLSRFWAPHFMPFPVTSWADLRWFSFHGQSLFQETLGLEFVGVGLLSVALGLFYGRRLGRARVWLCGLPLLLALVASAFHTYPFFRRLLLFSAPGLFILCAHGWGVWWETSQAASRRAAALVVASVLIPLFVTGAYRLYRGAPKHEIKPLLTQLQTRVATGDTLYIYYGAEYVYRYYAARFPLAVHHSFYGIQARKQWSRYAEELQAFRGRRVWFVFTRVHDQSGVDERLLFLSYLDKMGLRLETLYAPGAYAYYYDLRLSKPPLVAGARKVLEERDAVHSRG